MELLVESLQGFVKRLVPVRFGVVPTINSAEAAEQAKAIYYLLDTYGLGSVFDYVSSVCNFILLGTTQQNRTSLILRSH